jgi:hypothetical protein
MAAFEEVTSRPSRRRSIVIAAWVGQPVQDSTIASACPVPLMTLAV